MASDYALDGCAQVPDSIMFCKIIGMTGTWNVYIVRCSDGSLYTGIAKDVARRLGEHNGDNLLGARYTRARRPVILVYQEVLYTRSEASQREYSIKRMSKRVKEALLVSGRAETSKTSAMLR